MDMRNTNAKTDEGIFGMQRIQKYLQKIKGILVLMVMCGLFFNVPSTAQGFIARTNKNLDILLDKTDKPQWKIGYNFTADCPEAFRQQEEQLKEAITKTLQAWLQPLRERYPNRQFTDDFLLIKLPDVAACEEDRLALRELDTRITFDCVENANISFARIALAGAAPDICMRKGAAAGPDNQGFIFVLVHELGHAFGLDDTYVRGRAQSTGGLAHTAGMVLPTLRVSSLPQSWLEVSGKFAFHVTCRFISSRMTSTVLSISTSTCTKITRLATVPSLTTFVLSGMAYVSLSIR